MAKHRASGDDQLTRQGVIDTPGAAYWSVDDSRWPTVRPDLPAHLVDLLAPPIVVGVARVPVTSRLTPPTSADPLTSAVDSGPTDLVASAASPVPALPVPTPPAARCPSPSVAAPANPPASAGARPLASGADAAAEPATRPVAAARASRAGAARVAPPCREHRAGRHRPAGQRRAGERR